MDICLQLYFFPDPFQIFWMPKLITQYMLGIHRELIKREYYSIYNLFFISQFFWAFHSPGSPSKLFCCYLMQILLRLMAFSQGLFCYYRGRSAQQSPSTDLQGYVLDLFSFVLVDFQSVWLVNMDEKQFVS